MGELEGIEVEEVVVPYTCGEGLVGVDRPSPAKDLFQEGQAFIAVFGISRFVVEIPEQDVAVVPKGGEDVLYIFFECVGETGLVVVKFAGSRIQPELWMPGLGAGWGPGE